jgi:hypothetical protein
MKDQANSLKLVSVIAPQVITSGGGDVTGADVDRTGFESVTFALQVGSEGETLSGSVKFDLKVYESDSASPVSSGAVADAADIIVPDDQSAVLNASSSGIVATIDANAEAPATLKVGYKGGKKFVTILADQTGTMSTGTAVAVLAILGNPAAEPVAA